MGIITHECMQMCIRDRSMYSATNITYDKYGCCSYTLLINNEDSGTIELSVPGLHNVYNSLSACLLYTSTLSTY